MGATRPPTAAVRGDDASARNNHKTNIHTHCAPNFVKLICYIMEGIVFRPPLLDAPGGNATFPGLLRVYAADGRRQLAVERRARAAGALVGFLREYVEVGRRAALAAERVQHVSCRKLYSRTGCISPPTTFRRS